MRTTTKPARIAALTAGTAAVLLALAACSSAGGGGYAAPSAPSAPPASAASGAASGTVLKTGSTTLGTVVVDGKGMTAYVFDKDTPNATSSACTGACASLWPAIETSSDHPTVTGVTGTVGTITGVDGKKQVTLNGLPLYTFVNDKSIGDVTGQAYGGIWWVVGADGAKIAGTSSSSSSAPGTGYSK
ncbi:hypothetical protein [Leifsonia sp. SIMBA_070]|uniref:COG4315 family predicted lipoprotein n=2 Tax=Bacteria TaxID=2 RepID=UPI00397A0F05